MASASLPAEVFAEERRLEAVNGLNLSVPDTGREFVRRMVGARRRARQSSPGLCPICANFALSFRIGGTAGVVERA